MNIADITKFSVSVYGGMEKFSDTISKGRCRVFYKGRNRNGTYITDDFAEKLIQSAPYAPIKGIFDVDEGDFSDHGKARTEGRIYGVVPADPRFAWEKHIDEDGVEREYACFDVLYYTALYGEAAQIGGKPQSMELYYKTLKGDWKIVEGKKTYVFTEGSFLGLQALGDDVLPCFEGASFYNAQDESAATVDITVLLEKYEKSPELFQKFDQGGNENMDSIMFKLSDNQKFDYLFELLNPNCNEAGGWVMNYGICEVYDEYAVVCNYAEHKFERVYYTKNDETDSLEITNREQCYIIDVNESEKAAIASLKGESTYERAVEAIAAKDASIAELTEQNSQYAAQKEEHEQMVAMLTAERDEATNNYTAAGTKIEAYEAQISELTAERDTLATYKKGIEDAAKMAVIDAYAEQLSEEVIASYTANMDNYSIEDLDKELTYEQKKANPNLFTKTSAPVEAKIPKDEGARTINDILERYERH